MRGSCHRHTLRRSHQKQQDAEFVEEVKRDEEQNHAHHVSWCEDRAEDGADQDRVPTIRSQELPIRDARPPEKQDDQGHLERDRDRERQREYETDVLTEPEFLGDGPGATEWHREEFEGAGAVAGWNDDHEGAGRRFDPCLARCGIRGHLFEDREDRKSLAVGFDDAGAGVGNAEGIRRSRHAEGDQHLKHEREHHPVQEGETRRGQDGASRNQKVDESFFLVVEARLDELPGLPEDPGGGDDRRADETQLQIRGQHFGRPERLKSRRKSVGFHGGQRGEDQDAPDRGSEEEQEHRQRKRDDRREDQPFPEFLEMIAETHQALKMVRQRHGR